MPSCRRRFWRSFFALRHLPAAVLGAMREPVRLATMYIEFIYYDEYLLDGSSGIDFKMYTRMDIYINEIPMIQRTDCVCMLL
jgi:hypothetical protein